MAGRHHVHSRNDRATPRNLTEPPSKGNWKSSITSSSPAPPRIKPIRWWTGLPTLLIPSPSIAGLSILEDGLVVCAGRATDQCSNPDKPEKKDAPVKLVFYPLDGEIYRLALVSQDQKAKIFFAVIPAPIQATDNGCTLEVVSLRLKNQLVLIRGKGFQPNESVVFQSKS